MARSRKSGGQIFDPQVLWLVITVFVVGLLFGLWFGRKSAEHSKSPRHKKAVSAQKEKEAEVKRELQIQQIKRDAAAAARDVSVVPLPVAAKKENSFFSLFKKPGPKIAIVIDDVGNDIRLQELLWALPESVTLAILPQLPYSQYYSVEGKKRGHPVILHQPMEPLKEYGDEDKGMIKVAMSDWEIVDTLTKDLDSVPTAEGINNHKGSKATQDPRVMKIIVNELKTKDLFFFDSMTSLYSLGWKEARNQKVPTVQRDVFLDNETDPDYINQQIETLAQIAKKQGFAVGIGHYKPNTLHVLAEQLKRLEQEGFHIVSIRDLLK